MDLSFLNRAHRPIILLLLALFLLSCRQNAPFLEQVKSSHSGIHFNNLITENDSINQLDNGNVFNGGGVGIGDFNNDGLQDIFFSSNLGSSKLYLNKGNFKFQDITDEVKVSGEGKWIRGVAVVDINNDGKPDIYLCATNKSNPEDRKNLLYVNQGNDSQNIPRFKEMAAEFGLDVSVHSTQAVFFDYDNDGDIDMYLVVNEINDRNSPYQFHPVSKDGSNSSSNRLFRNDWNSQLHHSVFTDVSKQAGIQTEGYGNQASITDINKDGWKDIYVSNDFLSNDLLWINNHDGTFTEKLSTFFKHTSNSAMGNDVGDINNDGLMDFITLDMNPEDNYRKKMMLNPASYQFFQNSDRYEYGYQYVRNTLQLNQGPRIGVDDVIGDPAFSEIGYYAGIEATDWSWTPLLADFDNDGFKDLFIANGFPRDVTDHDFGMFRNKAWLSTPKAEILKQIPEVKLHNYIYRNNADLTFSDQSAAWGFSVPTFSNGAAYADFDNDGDLDLVINNINDEALLYRNNDREVNKENSHYLDIKLHGDSMNINGLGTWIEIYYSSGKKQVWENSPYRGYLSTSEEKAHFGLGRVTKVDSALIKWPNGLMERLIDLPTDQLLKVTIENGRIPYNWSNPQQAGKSLLKEVTGAVNVNFIHPETDFVDFNIQKLLPHKFSEYGPALAAGDLDGNGLDDLISGGSSQNSMQLFLQMKDGTFVQKPLQSGANLVSKTWDDMGILLFDADGDGDLDLLICSGGYENESNSSAYRDHFYVNDGKGNFTENIGAIPVNMVSKGCVRAADFDQNGDLDLFISGRVDPGNYPKPVSSFIYRNDSKNGEIKFTDITNEVAPGLSKIGLVCDALFTDFNNDGWMDLVLAGEWMPLTFFANEKGVYRNVTPQTGTENQLGWWNSITAGDFDNDGDIDYIAGNLGLNSYYRASPQYPVSIYAKDFDNNGSYDAFTSSYLKNSQFDTIRSDFPAFGRDDVVKQMIGLRSKFQNYKSYAVATIDQLFTQKQLEGALKLKANNFSSSFFRNDGNGHFTSFALPAQAQFSAMNGMVTDDFDGDGNLDVLINGNDFCTDVLVGRYDASNGLMLKGDGHGRFTPQSILESGLFIPGNGKAMVKLRGSNGKYLVAATQNRGPLKIFELREQTGSIALRKDEINATLTFKDGTTQKQEFYYGTSFLSQSARFILTGKNLKSVTITNQKGQTKSIDPNN